MKYGDGLPGIALADSLTSDYFLKPLTGFLDGTLKARLLGCGGVGAI
jgi:hypothetical protein